MFGEQTFVQLRTGLRTTFYKGTNVQGGECLDSLKAAEETDDSTLQMQQASSPSVLAMPAEIILNQRNYNYTLLLLLAACKLTHVYPFAAFGCVQIDSRILTHIRVSICTQPKGIIIT